MDRTNERGDDNLVKPQDACTLCGERSADRLVWSDDGTVEWRRSPGGLVSALHPVLRDTHATCIGWAGGIDSTPYIPDIDGVRLRAVPLSAEEFEEYYEGFSFGRFVKRHPDYKGHLTDLLIGNQWKDDVAAVFPLMDEMQAEMAAAAA